MKLGYKVKEINSNISRPRVFFISHDDDHEEYLSRVIAMLHEQSDCMVFYRETDDLHKSIGDEELGQTLSDMQLVVIPVTQKLLRKPSEAMSKVIPYALDHNIPVLPILMEKDPAGRYSKLFGNLQYLDANENDPTAEPFEKKLGTYLSEVLVSPETIQRIKDAFDACRNDPQHMYLIGLAYLDGINMEVDTDKARVLITEAADAGLEEAMRKLSLMYLHGKGVPKSLALSTQWQEQLMDSLLKRYRTDKSDEMLKEIYAEQNFLANRYFRLQDDRKALQAASYLKDFAEEKVRRNMTGSRHDLAFCTCKIGTMFHKLDDYYSARKYYEEAASIYSDLMNNEPSDEIRREFSMVYRYLGMLYNSRNNTEETLRNYKRSEELLLDIRDDGYGKATSRYLMSLYVYQAEVIAETERKDIALDLYTKASEIADTIPPEKADFREKTVLADLYSSMDSLYGKMGKSKEAKEFRRREIGILELQIEEAREAGMRYADTYIRKGWRHRWLDEQDEARRCFHMCLEAREEDSDLPAVNESHMNAYEALASLESRYGNHELAREYRIKEIETARTLVRKTGSVQHMDRLAECLEKLAGDDPDMLEEALSVRQKLYLTYKNSNYKIRKDNLRVRIDDLYKRKPELKRYRIAICSENRDKAEVTAETLLREGFIVTDMAEYPGIFEEFFIMETEPNLIMLFFDKNVEASYEAWKKWESKHLKYIFPRAEALVVAEHRNIIIVKRDSMVDDHEYSVRQYSDSDLISAIVLQLGMIDNSKWTDL